MSDELKKSILEAYLKHAENGETFGLYSREIAKELDFDYDDVITECDYLKDNGYLEDVRATMFDRDSLISVRITAKGRDALKTIFEPEWVLEEKKRKIKKEKLEERQIDLAENTHRWTKITAVLAIIISTVALIISIFKP